jgi:hypothetical protein
MQKVKFKHVAHSGEQAVLILVVIFTYIIAYEGSQKNMTDLNRIQLGKRS